MGFPGPDHFEDFRGGLDAAGAVGFGIREHVVVFAGARGAPHEVEALLNGGTLLHHLPHQLRHRFAVPGAFAFSTHFAEAELLFIHRGDAAGESCITDIDPGMAPVRPAHDHNRIFLQADAPEVVEDAAMVKVSSGRGLAQQGESTAVEQLRKEIRQSHFLGVQAGGGGEGIHFGQVPRIDERAGAAHCFLDFPKEPAPLVKGTANPHAIQNPLHHPADFFLQQGAVLAAHLLGRAGQKQDAGAIVILEPAGP